MLEGGLLIAIYVFVLAGFVGFEVITKVPPTLHTPSCPVRTPFPASRSSARCSSSAQARGH